MCYHPEVNTSNKIVTTTLTSSQNFRFKPQCHDLPSYARKTHNQQETGLIAVHTYRCSKTVCSIIALEELLSWLISLHGSSLSLFSLSVFPLFVLGSLVS